MTQPVKSDPVTLLALCSRIGLQGFESKPATTASEPNIQPVASPKPLAIANRSNSDASTVMALAKSARLQCVADETGAV